MSTPFVIFLSSLFLLASCTTSTQPKQQHTVVAHNQTTVQNKEVCINPTDILFLGIDVDSLCVKEKELSKKENIQKLFKVNKLDKYQYAKFLEDTKEYTDFENLKSKQKYFTITKASDKGELLQYLIFKLSEYEYIIANCTDTSTVEFTTNKTLKETNKADNLFKKSKAIKKHIVKAKKHQTIFYHPLQVSIYEKKIDTTKIKFAAVIEKSIYKTFKENKLDNKIIAQLNKAYNGGMDINKLHKGDTIQFVYDQLSINGRFLDLGHVEAICIKTKKKAYYAVDYFVEDDSSYQFTDEKGHYIKTAFLKSPLQKGGNIVSKFNLHRFHPILQMEKAHLGTDFAAAHGTPIIATASGIVIAAQFTQNNGNYIKIRHDKVYETQYLHMCRFARGVRNGARVQQGQIIGYVGSTGLATGPHVCYRFWKHGAQVDPLKEKLNIIKSIPKNELTAYLKYFNEQKILLSTIKINL